MDTCRKRSIEQDKHGASVSEMEVTEGIIYPEADEDSVRRMSERNSEESEGSTENKGPVQSESNRTATEESTRTSDLECNICGSDELIKEIVKEKYICLGCCYTIYKEIEEYMEAMNEKIIFQYNIDGEKEAPVIACHCGFDDVIPFDYYTVPVGKKFRLILCTICRGCGGYKEIPIYGETFRIHLRDPQLCAGLSVNVISKEAPLTYFR